MNLNQEEDNLIKAFEEDVVELLDMSYERRLAKACCNWMGIITAYSNENGISNTTSPSTFIDVNKLRDLAVYVEFTDLLDFSTAKQKVFPKLINDFSNKRTWDIIEELGLLDKTEIDEIGLIIDKIILDYPLEVDKHKKGEKDMVGFFMGIVIKKVKANPKELNILIRKKLN